MNLFQIKKELKESRGESKKFIFALNGDGDLKIMEKRDKSPGIHFRSYGDVCIDLADVKILRDYLNDKLGEP